MTRRTLGPQSQSVVRASVGRSQQDGDAQQQEAGPLLLPQLTRLHETYHVRGEDASNMTNIPLQHLVTMEIHKTLTALPGPQTYVCGLAPC